VTIPNSVTSIGSDAFSQCNNLKTLISLRETPPTTNDGLFYTEGDFTAVCLYVPVNSIDAYSSAETWQDFSCIKSANLTVTFNSQDGGTVDLQPVIVGNKVTEPAAPTRTGYTFGGWYKEAACTNAWDFAADTVMSDATLYAKWTIRNYTVTFNSQGGSAVTAQTISYGGKVIEPYPEPTRTGYYFEGWFKDVTCTNEWDFGVDVVGAADVTLYAGWTTIPEYAVHFNSQGGSAVSSEHVKEGGKATTPTAPTRTGHTFGGWYKEAACTNTWNFGTDVVTAEVTLYAKWTVNQVSVLESDRVIPTAKPPEAATVIAPVVILAGEFTAGPNPVSKESGIVKFYRQGKRVVNCELRIYDATGNVINKVKISDKVIGTQTRRQVGSWDLCDRNGRIVSEGTYLVKGVLKTSDGKSEKVSVILGVR
jgi:uncharacterized repeat protein (TIGR02543 family)